MKEAEEKNKETTEKEAHTKKRKEKKNRKIIKNGRQNNRHKIKTISLNFLVFALR